MPNQKEGIMLGIITPQGPIMLCLTLEAFTNLVQQLTVLLESISPTTIIPKVFEDAFKEEKDANTN